MEVLKCLGCPKPNNCRGVTFAVVEVQMPELGTVILVGKCGLSSLWDETSFLNHTL